MTAPLPGDPHASQGEAATDRLCDARPGDGINLTEQSLTREARIAMYPSQPVPHPGDVA